MKSTRKVNGMFSQQSASSGRRRSQVLGKLPFEPLEDRVLLAAQLVSRAQPAGIPVTANGNSIASGVSDDGRYIAYVTTATNVKTGITDANGDQDVYIYDMIDRTTALASHNSSSLTTTGNGKAGSATISGNGRYILFTNDSTNLITGQTDTNADMDLFSYDRTNGAIVLVSRSASSATTTGNNGVRSFAVSDDGRFVVFTSEATNLVTGQTDTNAGLDVFLWDRNSGTTKLLSHANGSLTTASDGVSDELVTIDQTGSRVAFSSAGTNLVAGQSDTNGGLDVFMNVTSSNSNVLASHSTAGNFTTANGASQAGRISGDGKYVVYASLGTDVVSGITDTNGGLDVFVFEFQTVTNQLVSRASTGSQTGNDVSTTQLAINGNGSKIAFISKASNLVNGQVDAGNTLDAFVFDRQFGSMGLVSAAISSAVTAANGASSNPTISDDGRLIVYESIGANLVSGQSGTAGMKNVFRYDTQTAKNKLLSFATTGVAVGGNGNSVLPLISGSGNQTLWTTAATNLIANDTNGFTDVFFEGSPIADNIGVHRSGTFFEDLNGDRAFTSADIQFVFGNSTDVPVAGDWDGDGYDNIGVFRNGAFYLDVNGNRIWDGVGGGDALASFGTTGDVPVIGDWNGDGKDDLGVKRSKTWYLDLNGNRTWDGSGGGDTVFEYGNPVDKPVIGDWNGDGRDKIGVFRNNAFFFLDQNGNRVWDGSVIDSTFTFGISTDRPVAGDWNLDGIDDIGVVRGNVWYLDRNGNKKWDGPVTDQTFTFGNPTDVPIVGRWAPKGFPSSSLPAPLSAGAQAPLSAGSSSSAAAPLATQIDASLGNSLKKSKGTTPDLIDEVFAGSV